MIELDRVSKRFNGFTAVDDLSFIAEDGCITGLLGPNGAGKTTALRIISGVLKADAGRIRVSGTDPAVDPAQVQKRLGALLDHTGLYPRLSARENLRYYAALRRLPAARRESRIEQLLAVLGLERIADRPVAGFSQGEHMKVALGRALIHEPTHLLLDEPTNGLDVPTVQALRRQLDAVRADGTCVLFSSHVLGEVEELCDRIVVLARGRTVATGTKAELLTHTRTETLEDAFLALTAEGSSC